jgi:hypothetical protein
LELEFIYGSPINATMMQEYTGTSCERKCREKIKRGCSSSKSGSKWSSLGIDACIRCIMLGLVVYIFAVEITHSMVRKLDSLGEIC